MANSDYESKAGEPIVVNCFQISNFVLWQTAAVLAALGVQAL